VRFTAARSAQHLREPQPELAAGIAPAFVRHQPGAPAGGGASAGIVRVRIGADLADEALPALQLAPVITTLPSPAVALPSIGVERVPRLQQLHHLIGTVVSRRGIYAKVSPEAISESLDTQ
jgi:hypothetical protein